MNFTSNSLNKLNFSVWQCVKICWHHDNQCVSCDPVPDPEVIKKISCSTQLSLKFFLLINVKMPTIFGILTVMSRKNSIISLSEPEKKLNFLLFLYL